MDIIPYSEMIRTEKELFSYDEQQVLKVIRKFERKQTGLMVYLKAVSEREELSEEEQDYLFTQTLVLWRVFAEHFPRLKKIPLDRIKATDDQTFRQIEELVERNEAAVLTAGEEEFASHSQPDLLGYLAARTLEEESELRQDTQGIIFLTLKNVLDLMIEASTSR